MGSNVVHLDTPISEVSYLDIPKKTLELINVRKQIGLFDKIEYGCYRHLVSKSSEEVLGTIWIIGSILILFFPLLLLSIFGAIPSVDTIVTTIQIHFLFSVLCFVFDLLRRNELKFPGFWFITDKGILTVRSSGSSIISFLSYSDIVAVNIISRPGSLSPTNSFLRILTKEGNLVDYTLDLFANEKAFEQFSVRLKQKLEEQHKLKNPSKKEINGI